MKQETASGTKGMVIFIVIAMLLIATIIISGMLNFTLSHYQQSFHRNSRIKAYYTALGGINLAMERLRSGEWAEWKGGSFQYLLCRYSGTDCYVNNTGMLYNVTVSVAGDDVNCTVNASVDYGLSL
ncbi:MAG: hypothetical protein JW788_05830 [Candidatus Omnitrophica bacterium]|nr:hypothetical protein [Candidatus Omnitrophota bacterium]